MDGIRLRNRNGTRSLREFDGLYRLQGHGDAVRLRRSAADRHRSVMPVAGRFGPTRGAFIYFGTAMAGCCHTPPARFSHIPFELSDWPRPRRLVRLSRLFSSLASSVSTATAAVLALDSIALVETM